MDAVHRTDPGHDPSVRFHGLLAAIGFNWFLTSLEALRRWARPIQKVAGILLVVIGVLLVTGRFAAVSASLAGLGQWINLEL